ncbi:MAG: hypothetical protein C4344_04910 [Acidimicrobiia bacterium]
MAAVNEARRRVSERYGFTDEEMWQIATITAQLNILPGIRARIKDSVAAVEQALETAIWATPAYRERVLRYQQQRRSDYSEEFRIDTTLPAEERLF